MKKRTRALFLKVITFFQIFSLTFQPLSLLSVFVLDPVVARAQGEAVVEEQVIAEPVVEANVQAEPAAADDAEEIIKHEDLDEDLIDIEEDLEGTPEEIPPVLDEEEPSEDDASDEADPELSIPEPTLTLMPTPMPTVAIAEEAQEPARTCLSPEQEVDVIYSNWSVDQEEDSAQSIDKVELGVEYAFPLDPAVSVSFTCLPEKAEDRSAIKIQRVLVSDLNLPDSVQANALYAYDITTDMSNGSFKYDLTLPKPEGVEAEVVYIEESIEKVMNGVESEDIKVVKEEKIDQKKNSVEVEGLDHFTIYIVSATVKISGQVNGSSQVTVMPGATITVTMEVQLSENEPNDWNSSRYQIEGGTSTCVNTPDHSNTGTHSESFDIIAPTTPGTYDLTLRAYDPSGCTGNNVQKVMQNAIIVQIPSNPPLPTQACGLDIALVLDVSGSIDNAELKQMKDAFKAFVDALSGTPTQFSVTKFDTTATVLQTFTSNYTAVKAAIDSADGSGYTNWQDGLNKAWSTYDPRTDKPNLIIFSSDGNPNRIGTGTTASEAQAVASAVGVANTIKGAGTRILALGIGSDLNTGNMIAISGTNVNTGILTSDVITSNFSTLAADLGELASKTCGGTITVKKYIDSTSTPGGEGWTYTVLGATTKYLETGTDGTANTGKITAGTYSVVETGIPSGYSYGSATCTNKAGATVGSIITNGRGSITVSDEDIISCDFINTTNKGSITIVKDAQPNHAQDFTFTTTGSGLSGFTLDDDDDNTLSNTKVFSDLNPGEFTVTEGTVSNWNLESISCDTGETIDLNNRKVTINLTPGENVTCTFVNTLSTGNIIVDKVTEPAGDTTSFSFTTTGLGYNGFSLKDTDSPNNQQLTAGTYSVSETPLSGWDKKSAVCVSSKGDTETIDNLKLDAGETITCTFTNTKHGKISGYKLNDKDGSASTTNDRSPVSGWTIFIDKDGDGQFDEGEPSTTTNFEGYYEFTGLLPGDYDIYEALELGWIVLVGSQKDITLSAGQNIENVNFVNVKEGSITVKKNVDGNGDGDLLDQQIDTIGSTGWKWTLDGVEYSTGSTKDSLKPGEYIIKEVNQDNYHFVSLECEGSDGIAISNDTATINLKSGEDVVCTYTNARNLGKLVVIKEVINDNGGTKKATDFSFKIGGGTATSFTQDGEDELKGKNEFTKYAGSSYDIVEVEANQDGYTTTYDTCTNVVVPHNGTATCTITNNDNTASLQLVKEVVNNNGGKAKATDWTLKADGPTTISGNGGVTSGTDFKAGTYTLSESAGPAGYSAGDWSCTNNIGVNENNQITLALGQSTVCTIVNDDIAPKLTLNKIVSNTNGGNKLESAWTLYAKQRDKIALSGKGAAGDKDVVSGGTFQAGTYTLSEEGPKGYSASDWKCEGGTLSGNNITLGVGQEAVCSITNSDIAPTLTVVKNVVNDNGGNATVNDFGIKRNKEALTFDEGVVNGTATTYTSTSAVNSNVLYKLTEDGHSGYKAGSWICKDNNTNAELAHPVTLSEGQDVTCAITNDDIAPSLTLVKEVENNYGGTAKATDWTLKADGPTTISGDGGVVSSAGFKAGTYTLSESVGSTDYSAGPWSCTNNVTVGEGNSIVLDVGQSTTCTITNSDSGLRNPLLSIVKSGSWVDANGDGYADVGETISYTFTVTNEGNEILTNVTVTDLLSGLGTISCPATTLAVGTDMTCTATYTITQADIDAGKVDNTAIADSEESPEDTDDETVDLPQNPALGIVKTADPSTYDEVGDVIKYSFEVTNTGNVTLTGPFTVSDDKATDESCPKTESLAPGATIICTASYEITLDDLEVESVTNVAFAQGYFGETPVVSPEDTETVTSTAGKITVYKYYDVNRDGVKDWNETTLADWEMVMSSDEEEDSIKQSTTESGSTLFYLPAGDWQLSETMQEDWEQTGIYCEHVEAGELISLPGEGYGCHGQCLGWNNCGDAATCALWACNINGYANLVSYGKDYPCTQLNNRHLFNYGPGSIQWNWGNWCGVSGVTDIYCSNGNGVPQRLVAYDSNGDVYQNNAYNLTVNPRGKKICYVGNALNSQLMIEKTNDAWPNDQEIGDEVTYTIKLMATDGPVYDVSLFDLPPNAFSYVAGSYMADSSIDGALSLSEPNYASPGTWQLGDLAKDEIITVSYKAIIGDEADAGIYPDAAWATGTSSQARYAGEEADLLALSDPNFKASNSEVAFLGDQGHYGEEHFVGTRVAVVTDETPSAKYKVEKIKEKEGEVLGAVLPATGANFWLSLLAIISILTGTGLLLVPNRKRRQGKVLMMLLMLGLGLLMAKPVQAITSVRLAQPYNSSAELDQDTITNQDEFRIDFVILNTDGASLTAQCQQQEDGGAWTNIDTVYTVKAGGNSGYCEAKDLANSSQYAFRVLTSDGEEGQSVKVGLETDRPKKPVSYEKHEISSCKYEIKFKTADDGRTSKVEVYRSDDNISFTAKASSRIKTISIGSDEKYSFETTRPDCDKDYYYAIRAFDQYGNASDLVGDREIKTVIVEGTEAEEAGALAVTETVVLDGNVGDDGVLSEGLLGEEVAEDEKGTILGIDTESLVSFLTKVLLPILVFVTIAILVYRLVIAKRNEKK